MDRQLDRTMAAIDTKLSKLQVPHNRLQLPPCCRLQLPPCCRLQRPPCCRLQLPPHHRLELPSPPAAAVHTPADSRLRQRQPLTAPRTPQNEIVFQTEASEKATRGETRMVRSALDQAINTLAQKVDVHESLLSSCVRMCTQRVVRCLSLHIHGSDSNRALRVRAQKCALKSVRSNVLLWAQPVG